MIARLKRELSVMRRAIGICFCLFHLVAITVWSLAPRMHSPLATSFREYFRPYIHYTGLHQYWTMFQVHPERHSFKIGIRATNKSGETKAFGPVLPGMHPYSSSLRMDQFFIAHRRNGKRLNKYVQSVCRAIQGGRLRGG